MRRLCAASLVGSTLVGSWRLTQNTSRRLQPASSPMAGIRRSRIGLAVPLSPTRKSRYVP
jgi:hypothetical protein